MKCRVIKLALYFVVLWVSTNYAQTTSMRDDDEWAVCTLEGLLELSSNAVAELQPLYADIQAVSSFVFF